MLISRPGGDQDANPSGKCINPSGPSPSCGKKCSCHERRRLHRSGGSVQMWIMALCRSGSRVLEIRPDLRWLLHLHTSFIKCVGNHSMRHKE